MRSWYTRSFPEMGYHVEQRRFGFYRRNAAVVDGPANRVVVQGVTAGLVAAFLSDVRAYYGGHPLGILVDNRRYDLELGPALQAAGCAAGNAETFLAHLGPAPGAPNIPDLVIESVTATTLAEWVVTKLKGFANGEEEPYAGATLPLARLCRRGLLATSICVAGQRCRRHRRIILP